MLSTNQRRHLRQHAAFFKEPFPTGQFLGALRCWLEGFVLPILLQRILHAQTQGADEAADEGVVPADYQDDRAKHFCTLTCDEIDLLEQVLPDANSSSPTDDVDAPIQPLTRMENMYWVPVERDYPRHHKQFAPVFVGDIALGLLAQTLRLPRWSAPPTLNHYFAGDYTHVSMLLCPSSSSVDGHFSSYYYGLVLSEHFDTVCRRQRFVLHFFPPQRARECTLFVRLLQQLGVLLLLPRSFGAYMDALFRPMTVLFKTHQRPQDKAPVSVCVHLRGRVPPAAWVALLSVFLPGIECIAAPRLEWMVRAISEHTPTVLVEGVYGVRATTALGCHTLVTVRRVCAEAPSPDDDGFRYTLTRHPPATGPDFYCCSGPVY
jgi:hypothetical protein